MIRIFFRNPVFGNGLVERYVRIRIYITVYFATIVRIFAFAICHNKIILNHEETSRSVFSSLHS